MLRFFRRVPKAQSDKETTLGGVPGQGQGLRTLGADPVGCSLSACATGARARILSLHCTDVDACRLRALGLCEGSDVKVVRTSDHTLVEVRGSRLAVGSAIASGIEVLPVG